MTALQSFARRYRRAVHLGLGLAAVGLLLWGRLILKEAPRTATADGPAYAWSSDAAPLNPVPRTAGPGPITPDVPVTGVKPGNLGKNAEGQAGRGKSESRESDDFARMPAAQPAAAEFTLLGVTTGKVPVARINGRSIRVGDTIQGFTLTACTEQGAVLRRGAHVLNLTVSP